MSFKIRRDKFLDRLTATVAEINTLIVDGTATIKDLSVTDVTTTDISAETLEVSGLSALGDVTATDVSTTTLEVSGVSALGNVTATDVSTATLEVSGTSTLADINASGIATFSTSAFFNGPSFFSAPVFLNTSIAVGAGPVNNLTNSGFSLVRLTSATANWDLNGIANPAFGGKMLVLFNKSGFTMTIRNNAAAGTTKIFSLVDVPVLNGGTATLMYEANSSGGPTGWYLLAKN